MSANTRNLKVFLSSSMREFLDLRATVKNELKELGIDCFVFEVEGASDHSPEEIFRAEIRESNLYIGVFGRGCGRYTREEFELARDCEIPCLLYFQIMDDGERSEEVRGFRGSLKGVSDVPTTYDFPSIPDLISQIKKNVVCSLAKGKDKERPYPNRIDPKNLPLLCDRDPQEVEFRKQVRSYFMARSRRPLLLILPGPVQEEHWRYIERIKIWSLRRHLKPLGIRVEEGTTTKVYRFNNSLCAMKNTEDVRMEIFEVLGVKMVDDRSIVAYLRRAGIKVLIIGASLCASECSWNPSKFIQLIADYLATFPDTNGGILMGMVVSLSEDQKQDLTNQSRNEDWTQTSIQKLKEQYRDGTKVLVASLPKLESPRRSEVDRWLEHDYVRRIVREPKLEDIFEGRESLPMKDLHPKLEELLRGKATL